MFAIQKSVVEDFQLEFNQIMEGQISGRSDEENEELIRKKLELKNLKISLQGDLNVDHFKPPRFFILPMYNELIEMVEKVVGDSQLLDKRS